VGEPGVLGVGGAGQVPDHALRHNRWKIRLDSSLSPDISVAARLDPSNQAQLDYYLLPRIDFGQSRISLAEQNPVEFESYHFESLDYLYGMAARARLRVAA
jgi:hypothetical protein